MFMRSGAKVGQLSDILPRRPPPVVPGGFAAYSFDLLEPAMAGHGHRDWYSFRLRMRKVPVSSVSFSAFNDIGKYSTLGRQRTLGGGKR